MPTTIEPENLLEAVRLDTEVVLEQLLSPTTDAFSIDDLDDGAGVFETSELGSAAVVWTYRGVHDKSFDGIVPTGATVTVEGVTVVSGDPGNRSYRRYIDWANVFYQIGLTIGTRPMVNP